MMNGTEQNPKAPISAHGRDDGRAMRATVSSTMCCTNEFDNKGNQPVWDLTDFDGSLT